MTKPEPLPLDGIELTGREMQVLMMCLYHADTGDLPDEFADEAADLHDKLADSFSRINGEQAAVIAPVNDA